MRVLRPFAAIVLLAAAAWPPPLAAAIDDIAIDAQGNILVAVRDLNQVLKVAPNETVSVFADTGRQRDFRDPGGDGGPAVAAELRRPSSVTVDPRTNEVYIADSLRVRKVDSSGIITTVAGNGEQGDGVAGGEFASEFALEWVHRIEFDPGSGKLYILQENGRIWRVENGRIYHHAGSGEEGCVDYEGPAAEAQFRDLLIWRSAPTGRFTWLNSDPAFTRSTPTGRRSRQLWATGDFGQTLSRTAHPLSGRASGYRRGWRSTPTTDCTLWAMTESSTGSSGTER